MRIEDICREANDMAHEKGWYSTRDRNFAEVIALMHSELSEALEEWRKGGAMAAIYYKEPELKPEGVCIELADVVIRLCDTCREFGIDLEKAIRVKMDYNKTRTFRHGGKLA